MRRLFIRLFDLETGEEGRVALLLLMSFFMGAFLATFSVAAQTLFLDNYDAKSDLPLAFAASGLVGMLAIMVYNYLQLRIPFRALGILSLSVITILTLIIEFGDRFIQSQQVIYYFAFTQLAPFTLIVLLIFWQSFNRLFNVRQNKRLFSSVDQGALIASLISFFGIPVILPMLPGLDALYTISLVSIIVFLSLFIWLSAQYSSDTWKLRWEKMHNRKISYREFFKNGYLLSLSALIVLGIIAMKFVDYLFLNVSTQRFNENQLATFLSLFEATVVIFSFLFQTFAADRLIADYGLRVAILVNPVLVGLFVAAAVIIGLVFGYTPDNPTFLFFFIMIAMSQLFVLSVKESIDEPALKLYELPLDTYIKNDVQTKLEGLITGFAIASAGLIIHALNQFHFQNLLYTTALTLPVVGLWYFIGNRIYLQYRKTLRDTLIKNKKKVAGNIEREFTVEKVLEKEIRGTVEEKVLYGLKLTEQLEPGLYEQAIVRLSQSSHAQIRHYAQERMQALGLEWNPESDPALRELALTARHAAEDSDLLSIPADRLVRLSKSVKPEDRILAARLLRKTNTEGSIFILLELLRDAHYRVRSEAITTARKLRRPETFIALIDMLSHPLYGNQAAAALIEAGETALPALETAFHRSGQSDQVMFRIVQIMGRIGGKQALELLWQKAEYPDKRIVKQILYSLRYVNYRATGRQTQLVTDLLDAEIGKTLWNLAALHELKEQEAFQVLRKALREEIRMNYDQITLLLSILYDPEAIQLVRENIQSRDPNGIAYALELMDLFVDSDLKPRLFPLLDDISIDKKLEKLQIFYPRERYNPIQVINYIINRDFNQSNRWTKACAIYTAYLLPEFRVNRGLIAQMFNQDRLLQEVAAWVIWSKDRNTYESISKRLSFRDRSRLQDVTEYHNRQGEFLLGIRIIFFLQQLPFFKNMDGIYLADLYDKITVHRLMPGEKLSWANEPYIPVLIVAHGRAILQGSSNLKQQLNTGDVYGTVFSAGNSETSFTELQAEVRTIVFSIGLPDFYAVIASHHEMVETLIRNVTENISQHHITPRS
jgi:HEAT repeat protein